MAIDNEKKWASLCAYALSTVPSHTVVFRTVSSVLNRFHPYPYPYRGFRNVRVILRRFHIMIITRQRCVSATPRIWSAPTRYPPVRPERTRARTRSRVERVYPWVRVTGTRSHALRGTVEDVFNSGRGRWSPIVISDYLDHPTDLIARHFLSSSNGMAVVANAIVRCHP